MRADENTATTTDGGANWFWGDYSATGNSAFQLFGSIPTFEDDATNDLNYNPVVYFNGSSSMTFLSTNGFTSGKTARTIITVGVTNSVTTTQYMVSWGSALTDEGVSLGALNTQGLLSGVTNNVTTGAGFWTSGAVQQLTATFAGNGGTVSLYGEGLLEPGGLTEGLNTILGTAVLGKSAFGGGNWQGNIAEVIVFNSALNAASLQRVGTYLAIKYGYTLNQSTATNYVNTAGTTIWNATTQATWSNNIAGLGKDNNETLLQLQSRSVNAGFQMAMAVGNSIAATNSANTGGITTDKSYMIWGDNDAATTFTRNITVGATTYNAMPRTWAFTKTAWTDQNITITQDSSVATYMLVATDAAFTNVVNVVPLSSGTATISSSKIPTGDFVTFAKIIPLPVTLISFTGENTKEGNLLSWETAREENNKYFSIERSTDGRTFTSIGEVAGQGTTNLEYNYTFLDASPVPNTTNYYRLRQVDDDGWYSLSSVVAINGVDGPTEYKAYPIPAHTTMHLAIPTQQARLYLNVYNVAGQLMQSQVAEAPGSGLDVDVTRLPTGLYFLNILQPDGEKKSLTFIKQ